MRFVASVFMVLTAVCAVISAYFIGHGLVGEEAWPWVTAAVLILCAVVFGFVYTRLSKHDSWAATPGGHGHH